MEIPEALDETRELVDENEPRGKGVKHIAFSALVFTLLITVFSLLSELSAHDSMKTWANTLLDATVSPKGINITQYKTDMHSLSREHLHYVIAISLLSTAVTLSSISSLTGKSLLWKIAFGMALIATLYGIIGIYQMFFA